MNYKEKIDELKEEKKQYKEVFDKYNEIENQILKLRGKFQNECRHENAYWYGQEHNSCEGRTYDKIYCLVCEKTWKERVSCGKHEYQSKEDYLSRDR